MPPTIFNEATKKKELNEIINTIIGKSSVFAMIYKKNKVNNPEDKAAFYNRMLAYFDNISKTESLNGPASELKGYIETFLRVSERAEHMDINDPEKYKSELMALQSDLRGLPRNFEKAQRGFIYKYGQKSLDNDFVKLSCGMSQALGDISEQMHIASRLTDLESINNQKTAIDNEYAELQKKISDFARSCDEIGADPENLSAEYDKSDAEALQQKEIIEQLDKIEKMGISGDKEISGFRDGLNRERDRLKAERNKTEEKLQTAKKFQNRIIQADTMISQEMSNLERMTNNLNDYRRQLDECNKTLNGSSSVVNEYTTAVEAELTFEKNSPAIKQYVANMRAGINMRQAMEIMNGLAGGPDLSEAIRTTQGGKPELMNNLDEDIKVRLESYLEARTLLGKVSPEVLGILEKSEQDKSAHIPAAFTKSKAGMINIFIKNTDDNVRKFESTPEYEKFISSRENIRSLRQKVSALNETSIEKNRLEALIKKTTVEMKWPQDMIVNLNSWKKDFNKEYGFPENHVPAKEDADKYLTAQVKNLTADLQKQKEKISLLGDKISDITKLPENIRNETFAAQKSKAENKLAQAQERMTKIGKLSTDKNELASEYKGIQEKYSKLQKAGGGKYLGTEYSFDYVRSKLANMPSEIFIKGESMTRECKAMYDQLQTVISKLEPDNLTKNKPSADEIHKDLEKLKENTGKYLQAKYAQTRPKWLASGQRYRRLAAAEGLLNYTNTAIDMVKTISATKGIAALEDFAVQKFDLSDNAVKENVSEMIRDAGQFKQSAVQNQKAI